LVIDQLWGAGTIRAANHIHLHPTLAFEQIEDAWWKIINAGLPLALVVRGDLSSAIQKGQTTRRQGWYSERFGQLEANSVLTLNYAGALPACFAYAICRNVVPSLDISEITNGHQVLVRMQNKTYALQLTRDQRPCVR
jgi:hypothetical protein